MSQNRRAGGSDFHRWQQNQSRQAQQAQRAAERAAAAASREAKLLHIASRRDEAERKTADVERWVKILDGLLVEGIRRSAKIDLRRFRRSVSRTAFDPAIWRRLLSGLHGASSSRRSRGCCRRCSEAVTVIRWQRRERDDDSTTTWEQQEHERAQRLARARAAFDARVAKERAECAEHNRRIDAEIAALNERRRQSVERYCEQVLSRLLLPPQFPRCAEVAYNTDAEQLVVQLQLPGPDVVPTAKAYRYFQSGQNADKIIETKRPDAEVKTEPRPRRGDSGRHPAGAPCGDTRSAPDGDHGHDCSSTHPDHIEHVS